MAEGRFPHLGKTHATFFINQKAQTLSLYSNQFFIAQGHCGWGRVPSEDNRHTSSTFIASVTRSYGKAVLHVAGFYLPAYRLVLLVHSKAPSTGEYSTATGMHREDAQLRTTRTGT